MPIPVLDEPTWRAAQAEANKVDCNKCGLCCKLPSGHDCKYLMRLPDGRGHCKIYNKAGRIGTPIGEGTKCNNILRVPVLFQGCPYNDVKIKYGISNATDVVKQ